ncbi:MAG: GGDEF domain-containing protein [Vicinamibacterales bacterium]
MTAAPLRAGAFSHAARNYWFAAAFGGVYFAGGFVLWGGSTPAVLSSTVFLVFAVVGFIAHLSGRWTSRHAVVAMILAHQLIGEAVLVWQKAYLPLSDYSITGNAADRDFIIYLVSALIVGTMSMFGGVLGAVLGLTAHFAFVFNLHEPVTFKWAFPILIAIAGVTQSIAFWRLDDAYEQLERLATHDSLTHLMNRHRLLPEFDRLQALARQRQRPLLLVAWDLDDLKRVNDEGGHAVGDAHIRAFASALDAHVRRGDGPREADAAFRVGGDEFISLHLDAPSGDAVVARVHAQFPPVSAGWVRAEGLSLDRAMSLADAALYDHKERRKTPPSPPRVAAAG